jgi:hypothetical protein
VDGTDLVRDWAAGTPGKLQPINALLAGVNMVSVDAIGVTLFGADPLGRWPSATGDSYLRLAHERGWGQADPTAIRVARVAL